MRFVGEVLFAIACGFGRVKSRSLATLRDDTCQFGNVDDPGERYYVAMVTGGMHAYVMIAFDYH
jgi:hypothetical protein